MDLLAFLIASLGCWALINFFLLPFSTSRWQTADLPQKVVQAGTLAVIEKLRDMAAVAFVSLSAVVVLVQLANLAAESSSDMPKVVITVTASTYTLAKNLAEGYGYTLIIVGLIAATIALLMVAGLAKQRITNAWIDKVNEVFARLINQPEEIEQVWNDKELRSIAERIQYLIQQLALAQQIDSPQPLTDEQADNLKNELSLALYNLASKKASREFDFWSALSKPGSYEKSSPPTFWHRIGRVLASQHFCKDIGLLKKPISYVVTGLLLISLIGWSAVPMADSLQLALNNMRVNAERSEAQHSFDKVMSLALQKTPEPTEEDDDPPVTDQVQTATQLIASVAAREMYRSSIITQLVGAKRNQAAEAEFVRAAISHQQAASYDDLGEIAGSGQLKERASIKGDDPGSQHRLQGYLESQIKPLVKQLHEKNPKQLKSIITKLKARYDTPLAPLDAVGKLFEQMIDLGILGINPYLSAEEPDKQAEKMLLEWGKKAFLTLVDNSARTHMADAILQAVRPDVVLSVHQPLVFETSTETRNFVQNLVNASLQYQASDQAREEQRISGLVAKRVAEQIPDQPGRRDRVIDNMSGYDHIFSELTPNPDMASENSSAMPSPNANSAKPKYANFRTASRSFRARGVLIGREHPSKLDVHDIRWTTGAPKDGSTPIALELQMGGTWREIGSFDASIINQALRYAADRRVIAATITPGDGKIIGRLTYLHPALLDTPLGCRVVEADRFIDAFTSSKSPFFGADSPSFNQLVQDRKQLWSWPGTIDVENAFARSIAIVRAIQKGIEKGELSEDTLARLPKTEVHSKNDVESRLKEQEEQVNILHPEEQFKFGNMAFSKDTADSIQNFIAIEELRNPGSTRILSKAHQCATGNRDQLSQCIWDLAGSYELTDAPYWMPVDHTSQFRERETVLTPDLVWLKRSPDHLGQIDFWIHTTLALHHGLLSNAPNELDEFSTTPIDFSTAQLADLRIQVLNSLPQYVEKQLRSSPEEFMAPLEDFVILQRLMRAGLDGRLGEQFPFAKLASLEQVTHKFVRSQPTIRWQQPDGQDSSQLQEILAKTDSKALRAYTSWEEGMKQRKEQGQPVCDKVSN